LWETGLRMDSSSREISPRSLTCAGCSLVSPHRCDAVVEYLKGGLGLQRSSPLYWYSYFPAPPSEILLVRMPLFLHWTTYPACFRRNQEPSMSKNSRYPTQWSDWEWNAGYQRWSQYRLDATASLAQVLEDTQILPLQPRMEMGAR